MNIEEIISITSGVIENSYKNISIDNIRIDSRKVKKNDLFICIKGKNYDGHNFIKEAIKAGAKAIIVDRKVKDYKVPVIKVDDTLKALIDIATYKRNNFKGTVIGVTGSYGKTMTKELLKDILSSKYKVISSVGNNNNRIGVALTLLEIKEETQIVILEMGMNHKGEIHELSIMAKPNIAVITNIGSSHIGNLDSKKNILLSKLEIVDGIKDGLLIINGDDKYLRKIKINQKIIKCGFNKKNDFNGLSLKNYYDKLEFYIDSYKRFIFNIPIESMANTLLLVIKIGLLLNIDINIIKQKVFDYQPLDRRYKVYNFKNNKVIDDTYNSSYESLKMSINSLNPNDNNLLIIGDILELGKYSKKTHKKLKHLFKHYKTLIVGEEISILKKKYKHFNDNKSLIEHLKLLDLNNYTILIKGSNALKLNEISKYLIKRFDS